MLEIQGLTRQFGGKKAVDAVNLKIDAGAFIGVIGRSGAVATTGLADALLRIAAYQDAGVDALLPQ